jgi:ribonuclease-3
LTSLEDRLGYRFNDPGLLTHALTHRSWCAEHEGEPSNERLEFLGDAVLQLVVTDHLFARFPDLTEGHLAKIRAAVVSARALADVGAGLGLGAGLRLGNGEDASGGREKASILADAAEAVIGAIYLDGGIGPSATLVIAELEADIEKAALLPGSADYKTRLQETAAHDRFGPPDYEIAQSGPDHHKRFQATVRVGGEVLGAGEGTSKKEAEQRAAQAAWESRQTREGPQNV